MEYQIDRKISVTEVQRLFQDVAPGLIGYAVSDAVVQMGPFNAYVDNDRGRIWYEWRSNEKILVLETQNGKISEIYLE